MKINRLETDFCYHVYIILEHNDNDDLSLKNIVSAITDKWVERVKSMGIAFEKDEQKFINYIKAYDRE